MRLLLAEDERSLSSALTVILNHNNYSVDAVYDGKSALDYLLTGNYDGAVLDIMMPKLDGITALRRAREEGVTTPVLLLTAKSEIDDRVKGLDSGADDYLTKPFASSELLARIRAMTRRRELPTVTALSFGDLTLNRASGQLSNENGVFRLGNKEFQMMEMLMENPSQLVPSDRFLEKIWGYDSEVESSSVWVYISYLRKKLSALHSPVRIKAARNLGYMLEVEK